MARSSQEDEDEEEISKAKQNNIFIQHDSDILAKKQQHDSDKQLPKLGCW
jgi:hypothetical protein